MYIQELNKRVNSNSIHFNGLVKVYNFRKNKCTSLITNAKQDELLNTAFSNYFRADTLNYGDYYFAQFTLAIENILKGITLPIKGESCVTQGIDRQCGNYKINKIYFGNLFGLEQVYKICEEENSSEEEY